MIGSTSASCRSGRRATSSGSSLDGGLLYALKEEPLEIARREYEVLRRLEAAELPAVTPVGLAEAPDRDEGICHDSTWAIRSSTGAS